MQGIIFNLQRFTIHDGPGIRTGVFFKGCPLRCQWCHNPEGLSFYPEIGYDERLCMHCLACVPTCKKGCHASSSENRHRFVREGCDACGACANACPTGALRLIGKEYSVGEVMELVLRDRPFYESSGGGLTLTGGEACMQADFAIALLYAAKAEGIHTCVETCGYVPLGKLMALAKVSDLMLYDVKELDPALHKEFTGHGNHRILENLSALDRAGVPLILRCPIIPGKNLRHEHFLAIASLAKTLSSVHRIELIPYHPMGIHKYSQIGMLPAYQNESLLHADELSEGLNIIRQMVSIPVDIT